MNLTTPILTAVQVALQVQDNVTDYLNGTVSAITTNSSLNGSHLIINSTTTVDYNSTTFPSYATDLNHTLDSNSLAGYNYTYDLNYTTNPGFNYTLDFTEDTSDWTEAMTSTQFPDMIVLVNENDPSELPTLNKTLTSKDLENKLNKAEKIGAIVGSVMAIIILAIIIAIYFLYRKYRSESSDY